MRRLMLILSILCACVQAARADEPFGVTLSNKAPQWRVELQERFQGPARPLILRIVAEVRTHPFHQWLAWVNQLVDLRVPGHCADKAVAAYEVLSELGYGDIRIVVGQDVRDDVPPAK